LKELKNIAGSNVKHHKLERTWGKEELKTENILETFFNLSNYCACLCKSECDSTFPVETNAFYEVHCFKVLRI